MVRTERTTHNPWLFSITPLLLLTLACAVPSYASNLVTNGDFELTTHGPNLELGFYTDEVGWTVADPHKGGSYFFVYSPGTADTTGALGQYGDIMLWGPGDGVANGFPATSPNGGDYIAADGAFQRGPMSQLISGLTPGTKYTLSFDWAAAQETGDFGANFDQWVVTFGSQTMSTPVVHIPSEGFSGWMSQSFTVTANSSSDLLTFLADGGPTGLPPFVLLDSVSLTSTTTPEPDTLMLMGTGLAGGLGVLNQFRSKKRG
jgi:PEP-CTERM motif